MLLSVLNPAPVVPSLSLRHHGRADIMSVGVRRPFLFLLQRHALRHPMIRSNWPFHRKSLPFLTASNTLFHPIFIRRWHSLPNQNPGPLISLWMLYSEAHPQNIRQRGDTSLALPNLNCAQDPFEGDSPPRPTLPPNSSTSSSLRSGTLVIERLTNIMKQRHHCITEGSEQDQTVRLIPIPKLVKHFCLFSTALYLYPVYSWNASLCQLPSEEEIWKAIKSIWDTKAQGLDGITAFFFIPKNTDLFFNVMLWMLLLNSSTLAASLKALNHTNFILIPKRDSPALVLIRKELYLMLGEVFPSLNHWEPSLCWNPSFSLGCSIGYLEDPLTASWSGRSTSTTLPILAKHVNGNTLANIQSFLKLSL